MRTSKKKGSTKGSKLSPSRIILKRAPSIGYPASLERHKCWNGARSLEPWPSLVVKLRGFDPRWWKQAHINYMKFMIHSWHSVEHDRLTPSWTRGGLTGAITSAAQANLEPALGQTTIPLNGVDVEGTIDSKLLPTMGRSKWQKGRTWVH